VTWAGELGTVEVTMGTDGADATPVPAEFVAVTVRT
jgi:hypothetical protein